MLQLHWIFRRHLLRILLRPEESSRFAHHEKQYQQHADRRNHQQEKKQVMRFPSDTRGSSPLILFLISVLLRCLPHRLLENGAEIMRIVVSDTLSDLTSTQLRSPQEDTGLFDPRFR